MCNSSGLLVDSVSVDLACVKPQKENLGVKVLLPVIADLSTKVAQLSTA